MDPEEYRKKIELEILEIIENKLKSQQMNAIRAQSIARLVLDSLQPDMSLDQIHAAAQSFDNNFPELTNVVLQIDNEYQDKIRQVVVAQAGALIKQGKTSKANELMQKTLNKQVKLGQ